MFYVINMYTYIFVYMYVCVYVCIQRHMCMCFVSIDMRFFFNLSIKDFLFL